MSVIVLAIKSCFFFEKNNYSLERKCHILHFWFLFSKEMIKVICAILAITIEDLKLRWDNPDLLLKKSAIRFEFLAQKKETGKKIVGLEYYKY